MLVALYIYRATNMLQGDCLLLLILSYKKNMAFFMDDVQLSHSYM